MGAVTNYYMVLGIPEDADSSAIRRAFRTLARRYHPDAGAGSSVVEFRRVLEAYDALSDPERRRVHDRQLRNARVRYTSPPAPLRPRWVRVHADLTDYPDPRQPLGRPSADSMTFSRSSGAILGGGTGELLALGLQDSH